MKKLDLRLLGLFLAGTLGGPFAATADDWPAYRGQNQDGHSSETGLFTEWQEEGPRRLWSASLGTGYSAISVVDGRVFTQFGDGTDEFAAAFSSENGKELWRVRTDRDRYDSFGRGPRSTPTIAGGTVFAMGALGKIFALDASSGHVRWSVDLVAEYGAKVPQWGVSTSPTVAGDLLLLDIGGRADYSLIALDRKTGSLRWHSQTDKPGYSTPLLAELAGESHAVFFTGTALVGVSPQSGRLFWRHPWQTSYDVNAAMPVAISPNRVFLSSGYDSGAALLEVKKNGEDFAVAEVWRSRHMKNHFNSSVLVGEHLYGFDNGTLKCIRADNGEQEWAQRGFSKGALIYADGFLIVLGEKGLLAVVQATSEAYREKARFEPFSTKTWTMPTLSEGVLYLRDEKELVAYDLKPGD
ncbi:MAG: PQQ-like beta-propeller repeat protein [Acidobacteriota bacterium]|nr:PQQ-like beta-propeller repeat protein [Acidobacteriota bacterium]